MKTEGRPREIKRRPLLRLRPRLTLLLRPLEVFLLDDALPVDLVPIALLPVDLLRDDLLREDLTRREDELPPPHPASQRPAARTRITHAPIKIVTNLFLIRSPLLQTAIVSICIEFDLMLADSPRDVKPDSQKNPTTQLVVGRCGRDRLPALDFGAPATTLLGTCHDPPPSARSSTPQACKASVLRDPEPVLQYILQCSRSFETCRAIRP